MVEELPQGSYTFHGMVLRHHGDSEEILIIKTRITTYLNIQTLNMIKGYDYFLSETKYRPNYCTCQMANRSSELHTTMIMEFRVPKKST
jgi:hypothetical protein